jgi:hypothetical protein
MPTFDLFSKRQKQLRSKASDSLTYDNIPSKFRQQIIYIWRDAIGDDNYFELARNMYAEIVNILRREYGVSSLVSEWYDKESEELENFFLTCEDNEKILDVIELVFHVIDNATRDFAYSLDASPNSTADEAIEELNGRFREHGIGYAYESGQLIRKDSEYLHSEVIKPVIRILENPEFQGANEEFMKALEHYRHENYKECLNECLKAFESTMKIICHKRNWQYNQNDTAKRLIEICLSNNLIPSFLQTQVTALKSVLESGVPTIRNKLSGHGQGTQKSTVPQHFAEYALHTTASTILFLVDSEKNLP